MADDSTYGPYETPAELSRACTAAYHAQAAIPVRQDACRLLVEACEATGIEVGAEDHRHITRLSAMELGTCAVFAGLIRRAYQAGLATRTRGAVVAPEGSGWISR